MGGFSQITGDPLGSVMNANNVSFDGTERGGVVTTDGQLLIGATALPHIRVSNLTAGPGISITNGPGSITIAGTITGSLVVNVQVFTSNGTYTPTTNMRYCTIEVVGGGGGGGGANTSVTPATGLGVGGGGGGYARKTVTAAAIGGSQSVTIGAGGTAGAAAGGTGGTGGTTSVGSIVSATGGAGGTSAVLTNGQVVGALGGVGINGDFNAHGGSSSIAFGVTVGYGSNGGNSIFGGGGLGGWASGAVPPTAGTTYGGGGGGAETQNSAAQAGAAGAAGIAIITEYIFA